MADEIPDLRCDMRSGESIAGKLVKVLVGPSKRRFLVHENVLRSTSAFFDTALKEEWREGQTRSIPLPEEEETMVQAYLPWLYCGKIPCANIPENNNKPGLADMSLLFLARLYCFGERILDSEFQDRVLDTFVLASRIGDDAGAFYVPSNRIIAVIYDGTPSGSPARQLMVDMQMWDRDAASIEETLPKEFLVEFAQALIHNRGLTEDDLNSKYRELGYGRPQRYYKVKDKVEQCSATKDKDNEQLAE